MRCVDLSRCTRASKLAVALLLTSSACSPASEDGPEFTTAPVTTLPPTGSTGTGSTSGTTTDTGDETMSTMGDGDASTGDGDGDSTTTTSTTDANNAVCGDGIVEGFESCDCGGTTDCSFEELDMMGCEDVMDPVSGNLFDGGVLSCNLSCQFDTTGCFVCGDGVKEDSEPCDGTEFGDSTCGSEGFLGGVLQCNPDCSLDTSMCTMAMWSDDFESGDFSGGSYVFGGTGQWSVGTDQASSGTHSAGSPSLSDSQQSDLELTFNFALPGTIAFLHREDTESCCDDLQFFIDNVQQQEWSGNTDWTDSSFPVTAGTHTFRWRFYKDISISTGADKVWVDDIRTDGVP